MYKNPAKPDILYLDTEYIRADETLQLAIVGGKRQIYIHSKNGYHSLVEGAYNLYLFLSGDIDARFECTDNEDDIESILSKL